MTSDNGREEQWEKGESFTWQLWDGDDMWYGPDEGGSCSMGSRKIATVEAAEVNDGE